MEFKLEHHTRGRCKLGDLPSKTIVTDVKNRPFIYIVIKPRTCGGLVVNPEHGYTVLCNLEWGTLREVSNTEIVQVLDGVCTLTKSKEEF